MAEWSTPQDLTAAYETVAASIEGWQRPAAHAVGLTSATSTQDYEFGHVNGAGEGPLPGVIMAKTVGHVSGSGTYPIGLTELRHALAALAPAEGVTSVPHPNLAAWRRMVLELETNPARELVAVFVGDLDDPPVSEAEVSLRTRLPG